MRRRELLTGLAALGSIGWADHAAAESLRHRLARGATDNDQVDLAEWEQIAWGYVTSTATTAPWDLLENLTVDLTLAQEHLGRLRTEADQHTMHRVMAQLCGFLAQAISDLGNPRISLRWWRTAKRLADASTDPMSAYTWPEVRLWHTASFVHTYLGNTRQAEIAHANALARYPRHQSAGCVQVRLHQALCLVRQGDVSQGVQHAHLVLDELPAVHRIGMVREVAHHILQAVPSVEHRRGDVAALRHEISLPPAKSGDADR